MTSERNGKTASMIAHDKVWAGDKWTHPSVEALISRVADTEAELSQLKTTVKFMEERYLSAHGGSWGDCKYQLENKELRSRVAAMEEALRKIAATADMKKYRPNELEKCCMPEYALDKEGFADMPIDMLRGLRYNATIAKQALEGAGCNGK